MLNKCGVVLSEFRFDSYENEMTAKILGETGSVEKC